MFIKHFNVWKIYFIIVAVSSLLRTIYFFHPSSDINLYFFIITTFNSLFFIDYFLNVTQVILHVLQCIPLYLFIYNKKILTKEHWQILFAVKIIFDLIGNSYPLNQLIAISTQDVFLASIALPWSVAIYIPSYCAFFLYAFQFDEIITEKN